MRDRNEELVNYLVPGKHVHLVGIGGVSMRPLGLVLKGMGVTVTGSDMSISASTKELEAKGIHVKIGHQAENIAGADCLIRTAAVHNDNPEIAAARRLGIPIFERAQAWGVIMRNYKNAVCVAGTHGKTTTTSMLTHIFMEARMDPTVMIGGNLPLLHCGHRVGKGDTILLESCEYYDSFLNFYPTLAVILNVEMDHVDYFRDLEQIQKSFREFALLSSGGVLAWGDSEHVLEALEGLQYISFGMEAHNRVTAKNISADWENFDVLCDGKPYCHVALRVIGKHNALNALAAAGAAWMLGIPGDAVERGLASFRGADRRMQYKGTYHGADVFDDYAHHPDELAATINAVKELKYQRIILAFQPHTYSRSKAFFHEFVRELQRVDVAVLTDIYAAREQDTFGISSRDIAQAIPNSIYCPTLQDVTQCLRGIAKEGDVILTVGAGDIFRAGEAIFE